MSVSLLVSAVMDQVWLYQSHTHIIYIYTHQGYIAWTEFKKRFGIYLRFEITSVTAQMLVWKAVDGLWLCSIAP